MIKGGLSLPERVVVSISNVNSMSSVLSGGGKYSVRAVDRADGSRQSGEAPEQELPGDSVRLSGDEPETRAPEAGEAGDKPQARTTGAGGTKQLDEHQRAKVEKLQARDRQVRAHEGAHQAAGGSVTGAASFTYETGPDGRQYAVGGEVSVRLERGRTPDETIANARRVRAAALAPADPSPQDLAVAASAMQMEMAAQQQKARAAARAYQKGGAQSTLHMIA
jgi:hypothetical protein